MPHVIPVYNHNNLQYFTDINVGGAQKFNVILDTGSDKLWVPSSECHSSVCQQHNRFDESKSGTFVNTNDSLKLSYGTGQVSARTGQDTVSLGGGIRKLEGYPIGVSTHVTNKPFSSLKPIDGIFGIGKNTRFTENEKLFSFYLSNDTASNGSLSLGRLDETHTHPGSPMVYHPTVSPDSWTIKLVDIKIGDQRLNLCGKSGCSALIDTGSSLITGPPDDVRHLLNSGIHQTCEGYKQSPSKNVTLIFSDENNHEVEYPLNSKEYSINFQDENKECKLGFGPLDMGRKRWVIGDTFLRRYVSVFDKENHRVGFVKSRHENEDIGVLSRQTPLIPGITLTNVMRSVRARTLGADFLFNN